MSNMIINNLLEFINNTPTVFHCAENIVRKLSDAQKTALFSLLQSFSVV